MRNKAASILWRSVWFSLGVLASTPAPAQKPATQDFTRNVDPFIGVDWGGNTFVGSAIPYGMVKVGPDMATFDSRRSGFGYSSYGYILGFSHLHLSGAQGKYGNILVAPVTGALNLTDIKTPRTDEVAKVGYYSAKLTRYRVDAELTSSRRVGFHRYTFPASRESHITVNVASALGLGSGVEAQKFLGAEIHLPSDREAQGVARFKGGWNEGGEYKVYYYMVLDTPATATRTWIGTALSEAKDATVVATTPEGPSIGASFDLSTKAGQVVQVKDEDPALVVFQLAHQPVVPADVMLVLRGPDPHDLLFIFLQPLPEGYHPAAVTDGVFLVHDTVVIAAGQYVPPPLPAGFDALGCVNVCDGAYRQFVLDLDDIPLHGRVQIKRLLQDTDVVVLKNDMDHAITI